MSILSKFKRQYGHLKKLGLEINGMVEIDYDRNISAIAVSHPFIFDNRLLPKKFENTIVRTSIYGDLPNEFQIEESNINRKEEYIWAPERFEKFVDRSIDQLRKTFDNPEMSRKEILDALCFGDFEEHKKRINERPT